MQRALSSYPLAGGVLAKLAAAGFQTGADLSGVGVAELSKELSVSRAEALEVLKTVCEGGGTPSKPPACGISALDLLKAEQLQKYIVTFCAKFDSMLGGGVPLGRITEICGVPGVGKTQFGMQLAVDATIPELFAGVGGEAVYIDTEGSFVVERVVDMATAAVSHLQCVASESSNRELQESAEQFSLESVLAAIHHFRCHDYVELVALVNLLPEFVLQHPNVKLVVVDSVACHFRHDFKDMGLRSRLLSGLAQSLIQLATHHQLAVVLTNQMTTRLSQKASAQLVPALGESWGHCSTIRVLLYWSEGERHALLYKSPNKRETAVPFRITGEGVRDVPPAGADSPPPPLSRGGVAEACSQLDSLTSSQVAALEDSQGCLDDEEEEEEEEEEGKPSQDDLVISHPLEQDPTSRNYGSASGSSSRPGVGASKHRLADSDSGEIPVKRRRL